EPEQPLVVQGEGVALQPGVDLLFGTVLAGVGPRVAAVAVRDRLDQGRTATGARRLDEAPGGVVDLVGVVAVDDEPPEPVRGGPGGPYRPGPGRGPPGGGPPGWGAGRGVGPRGGGGRRRRSLRPRRGGPGGRRGGGRGPPGDRRVLHVEVVLAHEHDRELPDG